MADEPKKYRQIVYFWLNPTKDGGFSYEAFKLEEGDVLDDAGHDVLSNGREYIRYANGNVVTILPSYAWKTDSMVTPIAPKDPNVSLNLR